MIKSGAPITGCYFFFFVAFFFAGFFVAFFAAFFFVAITPPYQSVVMN